jgi:GH15 family glucan-1,4-alpha-glucosidase
MKGVVRKGMSDDEERFQECLNCKDNVLCQAMRISKESDYIAPSLRGKYIALGVLSPDDPRVTAPPREASKK